MGCRSLSLAAEADQVSQRHTIVQLGRHPDPPEAPRTPGPNISATPIAAKGGIGLPPGLLNGPTTKNRPTLPADFPDDKRSAKRVPRRPIRTLRLQEHRQDVVTERNYRYGWVHTRIIGRGVGAIAIERQKTRLPPIALLATLRIAFIGVLTA